MINKAKKRPAYNESVQYSKPGFIQMKHGVIPPPQVMQRLTKGEEPYCKPNVH